MQKFHLELINRYQDKPDYASLKKKNSLVISHYLIMHGAPII